MVESEWIWKKKHFFYFESEKFWKSLYKYTQKKQVCLLEVFLQKLVFFSQQVFPLLVRETFSLTSNNWKTSKLFNMAEAEHENGGRAKKNLYRTNISHRMGKEKIIFNHALRKGYVSSKEGTFWISIILSCFHDKYFEGGVYQWKVRCTSRIFRIISAELWSNFQFFLPSTIGCWKSDSNHHIPSLKTNMAPENGWLEYWFPFWDGLCFKGVLLLVYRECIITAPLW